MSVNRPTPGDARLSGWQDEQRERLRKQARDKSDAPPPADISDEQIARDLSSTMTLLAGRSVLVNRDNAGEIRIRQRCTVCCADIEAAVTDTGTQSEITSAIGTRVRLSYLQHRCQPIEQSLLGATYEDLDEMFAACERDGQRLMDRAAEIDRLRKARSA